MKSDRQQVLLTYLKFEEYADNMTKKQKLCISGITFLLFEAFNIYLALFFLFLFKSCKSY
jgi:hypothetical protein